MNVVAMPAKTPVALPSLSYQSFNKTDFSGQDLSKMQVSGSEFINCNFDDADMSQGDWEKCNFTGSTFRRTNLYYTSFKQSVLACTVFEPKDAYGMTITCTCKTFQNMMPSQLWFYAFLMYATMVVPGQHPVKENLVDKLIAMIGAERYVRLKQMFSAREL